MDSFGKVFVPMGIAGLGLVSGFLALVFLMPSATPPRVADAVPSAAVRVGGVAVETPSQSVEAPPAAALASAARASTDVAQAAASPDAAQAPSQKGDVLHQPDQWTTAQAPAPSPADTEVEYDNIDVPAPSAKTPRGHKTPAAPREPAADGDGSAPAIDTSRARDLNRWKPAISGYSKRHYGEAEWALQPTCIVLHYTAGRLFPWNLVQGDRFDGEAPGLASHYVIDGRHIWQLVPPDVRSRGAYGINHRAINIEMLAADASDLARRPATLQACVRLVRWLMDTYQIPKEKVYSHTAVSRMNAREIPEVLDLVDPRPYGKSDPGEQNMKAIRAKL